MILEERSKDAKELEYSMLLSQKAMFEKEAGDRAGDRVLRSLVGCRLGARFRSRMSRELFLSWLGAVNELRGRASPLRTADRSLSPVYIKANRHTTVGALLASAQAQAECRDPRVRRALQLGGDRRLLS